MERIIAIKGGTVYTMEGKVLKDKVIVIKDGKIKEIINNIPENAKVIDAQGKFIYPGLIDIHTHTGLWEEGIGREGYDGNEYIDPVTPHLRALDGINFLDRGFEEAKANGITTVNIMPGSANVIGGQGVAVKTTGEILLNPSGIKMALGENPRRVYRSQNRMPSTRMGNAFLMRKALIETQNYIKKKEKDKYLFDLKYEALSGLFEGKYPARIHAHRQDDIVTAIRIMEEFNIKAVIEHSTEGHFVADFLSKKGIPCALGPIITTRVKQELKFRTPETAKVYEEKGVLFAFTTDYPVIPIYGLQLSTSIALQYGLSRETALKAITINGAKILGLDKRIGSIKEGKDADIIITDGDILEPVTKILYTLINGEIVYEYKGPESLLM